MKVNNHDVAGVIRRVRRFRYETVKAVSSSLASMGDADFKRAKEYLAAITAYLDWVVAQPQMDLPESSPREFDLGDQETLPIPENEALIDLENLYTTLEIEIGNSQSARMAGGLTVHDEGRVRAIVERANQFLDTYVSQIQPLDLPESTPLRPNTGAGNTGV